MVPQSLTLQNMDLVHTEWHLHYQTVHTQELLNIASSLMKIFILRNVFLIIKKVYTKHPLLFLKPLKSMKYEDKITYVILKAGFLGSCMRVIPLASFMRILSLVFVLTHSLTNVLVLYVSLCNPPTNMFSCKSMN